jgi:hypothetical protein
MTSIPGENKKTLWTRFIIWYRNSIRPVLDAYKYLILVFGWIVVLFAGYLGYYEVNPTGSIPGLLTLTIQILIAPAGNLQVSPSLLLNIARAGAILLLYISIIAFIAHWFYYQLELLWLRLFTRDHIVVCGLGHVGSIVTRNTLSARSTPIVVIEMDPTNKEIEWCKIHGITVITGNATERRTLEQAHISSAQAVYVATGSDEINATVVAQIHEIIPGRKDTLHCYVHIIDPNFTNLLRAPQMAASGISPVGLEFFNIYQIANFCVLDCVPDLIPVTPTPPERHILVIGLGNMGEGLIMEVAKRWMQSYGKCPGKKITITVIDRNADRKKAILETRYPRLCNYCEIVPCSIELQSPEFYEGHYLDNPDNKKPLDAAFLCLSDESLNFSTGLYLNQKLQENPIPIIIRTIHRTGLVHFFNQICAQNAEEYKNIHPFPLVSCSCCIESLVGMNELIARSIHRNYIAMRTREGASPDKDPALKPWQTLDIEYREASRSQAANIKRILHANGYSIVSRTDWDEALVEFSEPEIEKMAAMEHDRWWDHKVRRGWIPGPRELGKKTSPYLIPYNLLDERTKGYDRDFIRLYPAILAMVDLSIRRNNNESADRLQTPAVGWVYPVSAHDS